MKRQDLLMTLFAGLLVATACNQESEKISDEITQTDRQTDRQTGCYQIELSDMELTILLEKSFGTSKISANDAQTIAAEFIGNNSEKSLSKSQTTPKCDVYTSKHTSKKKSATEESDTLFFVLNYGEDNGYAVVSADVRVPQSVLAYSDKGSLNINSDNPGLSIFFNLAEEYVYESIADLENKRDSLEEELDKKLLDTNICATSKLSKAKTFVRVYEVPHVYEKITYSITDVVGPYLQTNWVQGAPFNSLMDYCPKCKTIQYSVGCNTIAFGQLMAYWRWPESINEETINWHNIVDLKKVNEWQVYKLIKYIADNLHTEYGHEKVSNEIKHYGKANPQMGINLLYKLGYRLKNSSLTSYSSSEIASSIDNKRPVIISGKQEDNSGHTWLIDGYINKTRYCEQTRIYVYIYDVDGNQVTDHLEYAVSTSSSPQYYFHCNWGWGEYDNGFYSDRVFDVDHRYKLSNGSTSVDLDSLFNKSTNNKDYYNSNLTISANIYH